MQKPIFAAALLLLAGACAERAPGDIDAIIIANTKARGGAAAIEGVRNIRTRIEIKEPTFEVMGDYRAKDGAMRIDIYSDGARVFSEGLDADGGWQQQGAGAPFTEQSAAGKAALGHGIEFNLFGLHQLAARGHTLALDGDETIDGIAYKVIKVTLSDGFETFLYLNPANGMVERRRDIRALHPDVDATQKLIENRYYDFEDYCGVKSSSRSEQVDATTGEIMQTTKVLSQACNLSDDDLAIERGAAVD